MHTGFEAIPHRRRCRGRHPPSQQRRNGESTTVPLITALARADHRNGIGPATPSTTSMTRPASSRACGTTEQIHSTTAGPETITTPNAVRSKPIAPQILSPSSADSVTTPTAEIGLDQRAPEGEHQHRIHRLTGLTGIDRFRPECQKSSFRDVSSVGTTSSLWPAHGHRHISHMTLSRRNSRSRTEFRYLVSETTPYLIASLASRARFWLWGGLLCRTW